VFHLKCNPKYNSICNLWWHQYNKSDKLFFSICSMLWSVSPVNTAQHYMFPITNTYVTWNSVTSRCIVVFGTSLSGYALLNASQTAVNNFDVKWCLGMNTHSACEYTVFAPTQLLHSWLEQQPSNQGDLDWVSWGRLGESVTRGWTCSWFYFCAVVHDFCWVAF
jgi:hypothetical protein